MASTYSNLKIQLMATGENNSTWGTVTNTNLGTAIEEAITGSVDVTFASGDVTLTLTNTNATQSARNLRLNCTGTTGGARNLILGSGCQIEKVYIVNNGCADAITVKNTTGSGIAVPAGKTMYVFNTGSNVVDAITHLTSLTLASPLPIASGGTGSATAAFNGENITSLNASNISSGTIANARTTAASANGASTIVARDASGNFSANTVTANLTGTASNATVLQTARTIAIQDGVTGTATSFNGSANISIPVTGINASVIDTGTIANARTTASSSNGASSIVLRDASGNFSANTITANLTGTASTATQTANSLTLATSGTGLSGSATFNGSSAQTFTVTSNASSANGASTIVARDASGNFSANTITANLTGTASSATTATTATTANQVANSLTLATSGTGLSGSATFNGSTAQSFTVTSNASSANGASTIVARDASGNFSANTITATLNGNASTATSATSATSATQLANSRNFSISGGATASAVSFNGTANVDLSVTGLNVSSANAGTLAVGRGGTGLTSVGTSGNVLSSDGSAWVSTFPQIYRSTSQSASGTTIPFTGIPSTVKQIFVIFDSVSANGGDNFLIQLGTSGGFVTSGYNSSSDFGGSQITSTAGFIMQIQDSGKSLTGTMIISNISSNTWIMSGNFRDAAALNGGGPTVGRIALSGTLTQLRAALTGSNSYDSGTINIMYQ